MTITTVHVKEITMAAPDIICVHVNDQEVEYGPLINHGSPDGTYTGSAVLRTDPTDGQSKYCVIVGKNCDYYRFYDKIPTQFLDRTAADNPINYPTIGGRTVTAVYRETMPLDESTGWDPGGYQVLSATMQHKIYLKLSGNLPQGGPYTVSITGNTFPATQFTFNDKTTRAEFIRATHIGHRAAESFKWAYLAGWIPGFGTEGRIDVPGLYSLTTFDIMDSAGGYIATGLPITLSIGPTTTPGYGNIWYVSTTQTPLHASSVITGNPTTIVTSTPHGFTTGDRAYCRGFAGLSNLDGNTPSLGDLFQVTVANTTAFTMPVDTSAQTYTAGNWGSGYDSMVYKAFNANDAATYVYKLDYSNVSLVPGTYYIHIPGLGVSDPFVVDENVPFKEAVAYAKGYYNQAHGYALNGWGGWTRPITNMTVYESLAPAVLVNETGWTSTQLVDAEAINHAPWITSNTVVGFDRSIRDAGDWDFHAIRHCIMSYELLEHGYRRLPAAAQGLSVGFPKASQFIGSTYSGIDALDDSIHMALMQLENFRVTQKGDGRIYSGLQFSSGHSTIGGGGGSLFEASFISASTAAALASDPISNVYYARSAAKMAQVFQELGFTTLANLWKTSAVNAFAWAENLYTDYKANGATGTQVQAYFNTTLGVQTKMSWTNAQFATWVANAFNYDDTRTAVAAMLYVITSDVTYYNNIFGPIVVAGNIINDGGFEGRIAAYELTTSSKIRTDFAANTAFINQLNGNYGPRTYAGGTQLQPYFLMEGAGGLTYQQTNSSTGIDNFVFFALSYAQPTSWSDVNIKMVCAQLQWQEGANQMGRSGITGFGNRGPRNTLIRDRQAMGLRGDQLVGTSVYFLNGNSGLLFVFNELGDSGPANYTAELYATGWDADAGKGKLLGYKSRLMPPRQSNYYDASVVIYQSEFVTQQTIIPSYIAARWRHAYANNGQTTASIQRIRRSLTAAP